jgi:uncharacterized membrane protein (Fun14 family)
MKIAAVVVGLFVAALAYLSYKGLIDVKWVAMENITRVYYHGIVLGSRHGVTTGR